MSKIPPPRRPGPSEKTAPPERHEKSVRVELPEFDPPDLLGVASAFAVEEGEWNWYLVLHDPRWGVVANIVISVDAIVGHLWPSSQRFFDDTNAWLESRGIPSSAATAMPPLPHPIAYQANLFRLARHGLEAQLEGFCLTPSSIVKVRQRRGAPEVLPVVTVQLPLQVLHGFLALVRDRFPELRARMEAARIVPSPSIMEEEGESDA